MKWKKQILDLEPYQPGRTIEAVKKEFNLEKVTKLASNENPFGCSPLVKEWLKNFDRSFALYPDGYATELRKEMAKHLNIEENQLLFGNGSDNILQVVSSTILEPGKNTVMAVPTFSQYRHNAVIAGAEVREVPLINGAHDLDGMLAAIDENTAIVWICNPNNPTGVYITEDEMIPFLKKVPDHVLVVLDEAYREYVVADDIYDAVSLVKTFKNVLVTRTFSKIYGMASFRVGYAFGHPDIIKYFNAVREPFNVNTFGQGAAVQALRDQEFIEECRKKNRQGLEQFYEFCRQEKLNYFSSQTNFILIDFGCNGDDVFHYLMTKGYIVRSGNALGFPTSVRVTVGSKEQNEGVIEAMRSFIKERAIG